MSWILVIVLSTGAVNKSFFNTSAACNKVQRHIIMSTLPKLQSALCIEDKEATFLTQIVRSHDVN